jgi:crotonobetainyl-CoA:carnitine CoA-transferase CaiB-like acyl-CoA transferase
VRAEVPAWRRAAAPTTTAAPAACLDGMRVLDLTSFIAGPVCPMLLADLGADVVKIESAEGDPFRMTAFGFVGWNRGKRSLVLDLKRPDGAAVLLDLARAADVVVDNFRGGVMDRLGIGWDRLQAANPRLVHTSITGFGSYGPLAALPGFDPVFQARSGLAAAQGGTDEPALHVIAYHDYCAGAFGALATVAALDARERTGRGQRVDVSLFRTAFTAQAADMVDWPGRPPWPAGGRDYTGPSAARRLYACRDGWVCVAAGTPGEAAALGRMAGMPLAPEAAPDGPAAAAVGRALAALTRAQALDALAAGGVPAAPCLGFEDVFADPFLRATSLAEQDHPALGRLELPGPFVRFSATPIVLRRSAPLLGADGRAVLGEIGYTDARVDGLIAAGVVGRPAGE